MRTYTVLPVVLAVFVINEIYQVKGAKRYQHGEKCNKTENWCNYGKWMWCRRGICECLHPHRQRYDSVRDRCVGIPNTECNVYIGERDCTAGSTCAFVNGTSICQCKKGYELDVQTIRCLPLTAPEENLLRNYQNDERFPTKKPFKLSYPVNPSHSSDIYSRPVQNIRNTLQETQSVKNVPTFQSILDLFRRLRILFNSDQQNINI